MNDIALDPAGWVALAQTLQLPVAEPLGFPDYRDFTADVAAALGTQTISAPVPSSARSSSW